jgi:ligand-binding sensor domain-containing protein/AraC-like DNA-binding protein
MKNKLLITITTVLCLIGCQAQAQIFSVNRLPTQSQLPVANISTVYQDSEGFMWYGTIGGGLCRDNGYQINVFRPDILLGEPEAKNVLCIAEDCHGNIWFGTDVGLFRLDRQTLCLSMPYNLRGRTFVLEKDRKGQLWAGIENAIYKLSPDGEKILSAFHDIPSWRVNQFFEDSSHRFYVLLSGAMLKRDKNGILRQVKLKEPIDPVNMTEDAAGRHWIATWGDGIVYMDATHDTFIQQPVTKTTHDKAHCLSMLIDSRQGLMWVTTLDNVYVYRIDGCRLIPYETKTFLSPEQKILDLLYEDHDGNIWVPGFIPNTFIITPNSEAMRRYPLEPMRKQTGYPLIPDRFVVLGNDIWIHQGRCGLMHYSISTDALTMTGGTTYSTCIEQDRMGQGLWAARRNVFVHLIYNNRLIEDSLATLPDDIKRIYDCGKGFVYIGTPKAIYEYSLTGRRLKKLCQCDAPIVDMVMRGNILYFIVKDKGLFKQTFRNRSTPSVILPSSFLSALSVNTDGSLWIVSEDGKVYSATDDKLKENSQLSNVGNESFIDVACDTRGHVWTLCNQYAIEFNPRTHAFRTLRNHDPEVNVAYFFHLEEVKGDSMGIGGTGAFFVVPSSLTLDRPSASERRPIVTAVILGDSVKIVDGRTKQIDISSDQGTFSLQLSTLDIMNAKKISFAYRIEGWNTDWIYLPQGVNTLYISNLPKGYYHLHIRATDGSGCWQQIEGDIILHHLPLWWQTWWVRLLFLLTAAGILYSLWLLGRRIQELHHLQRQRKELALREIAAPSHQELLAEKDKEFLHQVKDLVEQNISDAQYNVEHLASDMCMSHSTLYRRLQPLTGQSPVEFIRDIRLKQAAQILLSHPDLPVSNVAGRVGFAVSGYFTKCFKEQFGVLPTQYANTTNEAK